MYFVFVLLWVGLCAIPGSLAKEKGMGFGMGFFIGLVLGPVIGTLVVALIPGNKSARPPRRRMRPTPRDTAGPAKPAGSVKLQGTGKPKLARRPLTRK